MKATVSEVRVRRPRGNPTASRMVETADHLERTFAARDALPRRTADRSLIGDLADLEWRTAVLWQAIHDLVATRRGAVLSDEFDTRLLALSASVDAVGDVIRDLRGPLTRLLRARCGNEGLALAALAGASATIQGFKTPRGRKE